MRFFSSFLLKNADASANLRGVLWILLGAICFTSQHGIIKHLGSELPTAQIVFFRCLFQFMILLPFLYREGFSSMRSKKAGLYSLRILFGLSNMVLSFFALSQIPLATATSLAFSRPLFMILLAIPLLGERPGVKRSLATFVGFIGVLTIVNPDSANLEPGVFAALCAAVCLSLTQIIIKKLSVTESHIAMLSWFALISACIAGGFILIAPSFFPDFPVWTTPTWGLIAILFLSGIVGTAGQFCTIRAFFHGEATVISPFDYLQLPFSALVGLLFFLEIPDTYTLIGASIIILSNIYILRRSGVRAPKSLDADIQGTA